MTSPRRARTVAEASAPLEHYLIPVPQRGADVCTVCHGSVYDGHPVCYPCANARWVLGGLRLDAVTFVALAPAGGQLARDLYTYKRPNVPPHLRSTRTVGLAAVLWRCLAAHERCLAAAAGCGGFDLVATVPSTGGRTQPHPLATLVGNVVAGTAERVREVLMLNRTDLDQRQPARDRFAVRSDVRGRDVLLIDDTWTTGAKMQSASAALKTAGARRVGGVAIGRWLTVDYRDNAAWLTAAQRCSWTWDTCCLE
ncbi:phosphoribosyltransferase [Prauserella muralis]|uniref:phosphoribosyltransferase n=1 Tax=Prauserella muralis TaxID=588067 RepID=UPI0011ACCE26|nr:phosphoribosyltransferase [Prauserella muralis]TWE27428.1 hypothetical protein FHX69_0055 [Prauserella muralis]